MSAYLSETNNRKDGSGRRNIREGMSLLKHELKQLETKQGVKFKTGFMNQGAKKLMAAEVLVLMRGDKKTWKIGKYDMM